MMLAPGEVGSSVTLDTQSSAHFFPQMLLFRLSFGAGGWKPRVDPVGWTAPFCELVNRPGLQSVISTAKSGGSSPVELNILQRCKENTTSFDALLSNDYFCLTVGGYEPDADAELNALGKEGLGKCHQL